MRPRNDNGAYNSLCNAAGMGDGTCIPYFQVEPQIVVGFCTQGGASTTCCDALSASRCDPAGACAAGMICHQGVCAAACQSGVIPCAGGGKCVNVSDNPPSGVCPSSAVCP